MLANLLLVAGVALAITAILMTAAALIGRARDRVSVIDTAWPIGFALIAVECLLLGDGALWRRVLLVVLTGIWAGRLAWYVHHRNTGKGEDKRYEKILSAAPENGRFAYGIKRVFIPQAFALWFVSLPLQVSAAASTGWWWMAVLGSLVWAAGLWFESTGDRQLAQFKAQSENHGKIMDQGLWAWTRHPNYFGDFMVWWGLYLVAATTWPGALTITSPVAMALFLIFVTGGKLLEKDMAARPGYRQYQQKTSFFFPRPPRSHRHTAENN